MNKLRFAVFGAGAVGALRSAAVAGSAQTELVAVVDVDGSRAQAISARTKARPAEDYVRLLDEEPLDAVIVSSPTQFHEEMCVAALTAGCHVLCEKPLSNSVESCRRIVAAANDHSRTLAVGFNHRYYPSVKFLKKCLDEATIGTVDHVRAFGGHDGHGSFREEWMFKGPISGGGSMMDVGIHMTDLVNFVAGNVTEVSAISTGSVWNVEGSEDNAVAVMRTTRGIPVIFQATWTEWKGYRVVLEAYGDRGMVRAYYAPMFNLLITQESPGAKRKRRVKFYPEIMLREKLWGWETTTRRTFDEELEDFVRMINGGAVSLATGDAGVLAVEVAQAVYRSSRLHETVRVRA